MTHNSCTVKYLVLPLKKKEGLRGFSLMDQHPSNERSSVRNQCIPGGIARSFLVK